MRKSFRPSTTTGVIQALGAASAMEATGAPLSSFARKHEPVTAKLLAPDPNQVETRSGKRPHQTPVLLTLKRLLQKELSWHPPLHRQPPLHGQGQRGRGTTPEEHAQRSYTSGCEIRAQLQAATRLARSSACSHVITAKVGNAAHPGGQQ